MKYNQQQHSSFSQPYTAFNVDISKHGHATCHIGFCRYASRFHGNIRDPINYLNSSHIYPPSILSQPIIDIVLEQNRIKKAHPDRHAPEQFLINLDPHVCQTSNFIDNLLGEVPSVRQQCNHSVFKYSPEGVVT